MKIAAIIQARMGSTRLPGKVLRTLCGRSILAYVGDRLSNGQPAWCEMFFCQMVSAVVPERQASRSLHRPSSGQTDIPSAQWPHFSAITP